MFKHLYHDDIWVNEGVAPRILNLSIIFSPGQIHARTALPTIPLYQLHTGRIA
jgi:hypothetical protein